MSSTWGNILKLSIFGESHGPAVGMVLDGLPAGEKIDLDAVQVQMDRRAPGLTAGSSRAAKRTGRNFSPACWMGSLPVRPYAL